MRFQKWFAVLALLLAPAPAFAQTPFNGPVFGSPWAYIDFSGTTTGSVICLTSAADACVTRGGAGIINLTNAAAGTTFTRLNFGTALASNPALKVSTTHLQVRLADDSGFAPLDAGAAVFAGSVFISGGSGFGVGNLGIAGIAPSAPSACGTSPAVTVANGSAAWVVTGGTGGAATGCTVTMTAATTGWNCLVENITANAAHRADRKTVQTASTTSSVTWEYQIVSTGAATPFTASDVFRGLCYAY